MPVVIPAMISFLQVLTVVARRSSSGRPEAAQEV